MVATEIEAHNQPIGPEIIFKYFTNLSPSQKLQFEQLGDLYRDHNAKVNVISRKDMDMFYVHHVLHSLALAKTCEFIPGQHFIDIGTGGGFPGIPLAIMFPQVKFTLVDSIGKKINVVQSVINAIGLVNAAAIQQRTELLPMKFDGAIARAVGPAIEIWNWMQHSWSGKPRIFLLKGGDLAAEINEVIEASQKTKIKFHSIAEIFPDQPFFETKKVVKLYHS